jgi:succinoglycan biosynthesis transport protein ExoP
MMNRDPLNNRQQLPASEILPVRPVEVVYRDPAQPEYVTESQQGTLHQYLETFSRHRGILFLAAFLGGVAGYVYTAPDTPIYQAHTTVEVQGINNGFLNIREVNPNTDGPGADPVTDLLTQVEIMQSQSLRDRVVKKLREQKGDEVLDPTDRLSAWKKALGLSTAKPMTRDQAIAAAAGAISVKASGTTRIIEVSCDAADPKIAAEVANTLVSEFIDQTLESRLNSSEKTGEWLSRQMEDLKVKLEKSEDQLQAYATSVGLQLTTESGKNGDKENVADEKLRQLQAEMLKAQSERVAAQSRYELVTSTSADALPQVLDDPSLRDYGLKLTTLRQQLAELSSSLTPANPKVKRVEAQIEEVEAALKKERGNVVERMRNDYAAAQRRELLISADYERQVKVVNEQAGKVIHYSILKREVDTNRQVYEAMLQKVKEADIASAMRASGFRVVDPAKPPGGPYKPNPSRSATMGVFGGIFLGLVFVLIRERADRSLQQPGDLSTYLNLPELGVIPSARAARLRKRTGVAAEPGSKLLPEVALSTLGARSVPLAESFQATVTSILFTSHNGFPPQVLAISSAGPAEGKSTVTLNLGLALAEINQRVLVIDGDMRRPKQHEMLRLSNKKGLSDLLKDRNSILGRPTAEFLQPTDVPGLCLLSSGPPVANASNLFHSPRMAELIRAVRSEFDAILIDTPPTLHLADARVVGQHCDAVILVVRAGKTTRDAALAVRRKFEQDGTPILGTVLNDWDPGSGSGSYGSSYYRSYAKYYQRKN